MAEKNLDFDRVVKRRKTNSIKYDFAVQRGMPEGIQPLWVADMDFKTSSYIQEALQKQIEHGVFGYSDTSEEYFEALENWQERHYGWQPKREWLVKTPGVVFALAMCVKAFTKPGEGVMIQQPVYYPFRGVIEDNGRRVVDNTLIQDEEGGYRMDFADLEDKIIREQIGLFFLCNPHNPVGRVWSKEELERLGDICRKHQVIVVSDEIHADFIFQGKHHVFAGVKEGNQEFTITCTAPSKTFNLAGLQVSNILIANSGLRKKFKKEISAAGYSQLNGLGITACQAAYQYGEEWYQGLMKYLKGNICYTREYLIEHIPQVKMREPEGTYLVWLDFRDLHLSPQELENLIVHKAGLWLDSGTIFGDAGTGFQRINIACPRELLQKALESLEEAVKGLA